MKNKQITFLLISILPICSICIAILYIIGKPNSYIWVMDVGDRLHESYLVKMCPTGERLSQTQLGQSWTIGIDPQKNIIWTADRDEEQLVGVDNHGHAISHFQGYSALILAVDPNDGSIWLPIWISAKNKSLMIKINSNGKLVHQVDGFYLPYSIALDPRDSSIWVGDGGLGILTHISANGHNLFELHKTATFFSDAPHQIAIDPHNGNVWFTASDRVHKMSAEGQILATTGGFKTAVALTINPMNGDVWVADFGNVLQMGDIVKLDPTGKIILTLDMPNHPHAIGINPFDGTLWVGLDGKLLQYYSDGRFVRALTGFKKPLSMAFAKSENDLMTDVKCAFYFYLDMF